MSTCDVLVSLSYRADEREANLAAGLVSNLVDGMA